MTILEFLLIFDTYTWSIHEVYMIYSWTAAAQSIVGPGGMILAELDMLLTEEQFSTLYEPPE
jgi:hypothetical protein